VGDYLGLDRFMRGLRSGTGRYESGRIMMRAGERLLGTDLRNVGYDGPV